MRMSVLANVVNQIPDKVFHHIDAKIWQIQYCHKAVLIVDL